MNNTLFGLDLAKTVFHLVELDARSGRELSRKTFKRSALIRFFSRHVPSRIVIEAWGGSHYWARTFAAMGHTPALLPPQHVKAYLRGQKNDYNDALAIAEAALQGRIRAVPIKTVEQQDAQLLHRVRTRLVKERTGLINQIRGLLSEYGIVLNRGASVVRRVWPELLADDACGLSTPCKAIIDRLYQRLLDLDIEIDYFDQQLQQQVRENDVCQRLLTVPGFGVIVASSVYQWLGDGRQFHRGRDASAALGIVPRQHSSGGKEKLSGITKRGDRHLRSLVIHGARSVAILGKRKQDPLSQWINRLIERRGFNKAVVALANKMMRIAWVIVARDEHYQPRVASVS